MEQPVHSLQERGRGTCILSNLQRVHSFLALEVPNFKSAPLEPLRTALTKTGSEDKLVQLLITYELTKHRRVLVYKGTLATIS